MESVNLNSRTVSAVLLLTGLALCLGSALGFTKALCLTEGCKLYQAYGFLGLSLHIWGAAAFGTGLILLLCPLGRLSVYRRFLHICLWAEIVLLALQVVYMPCSECLLVGLIWGLLGLVEMQGRLSVKVWSAVFLVALVLLGKETLHPWPVYGSANSGVKVYFSPSCPGCKIEINKLLAGGEVDAGRVAFFPVALKSGDYERVEAFQNVLKHTLNVDQAFQACWTATVHAPAGWFEWLRVRFGLMRNRMVLARMGVNKIPLVISGSAGTVTGPQVNDSGECGFDKGKDCADDGDSIGPDAHPDGLQGIRRDGFKIRGRVSQDRGASVLVAQAQTEGTEPLIPEIQVPDISVYFQDGQDEAETTPQSGDADEENHENQSQPDE
jgi:hypothetical protein